MSGNGEFLYPEGCDSIETCPNDLALAINHALTIVNWQKNLQSDDMPPSWMWAFDEELVDWFDAVEAKHEAESNGQHVETADMMQNEYAMDFDR